MMQTSKGHSENPGLTQGSDEGARRVCLENFKNRDGTKRVTQHA